ncbi:g8770 [Coccomyxa viridis]|uniref:G8770 protein n=1 Tax=Coccomyxa viridis TaxID=1274662 RepID=A0ABP1G7J8_9CHLO
MTKGYGMCGLVPISFFVLNNDTGQRSIGQFPAGPCPVAAIGISAGVAALLVVTLAMCIVFVRRRQSTKTSSMQMTLISSSSASLGAPSSTETMHLVLNDSREALVLGQGSFGKVYKARWNGVLVAVKALNNGAQEVGDELQKEAIILSSLRHPHIVKFAGALQRWGREGGNLAAALAADNPDVRKLAWYEKGKPIAQGVASGLAYLHARKRGTLDYMAPELMGTYDEENTLSHPITSAVDVYSFGLVLWQIVTGEVPDKAAGPLRSPRGFSNNTYRPAVGAVGDVAALAINTGMYP